MFHTATLTAHRGATIVNRDDLARYEPPEAEGRWKPVKHSLIVDLMHEELSRRAIQITNEEYAIQREGELSLCRADDQLAGYRRNCRGHRVQALE